MGVLFLRVPKGALAIGVGMGARREGRTYNTDRIKPDLDQDSKGGGSTTLPGMLLISYSM